MPSQIDISEEDIQPKLEEISMNCAWKGCEAMFSGERPLGWINLLT
jgi:hypothetical protein